ncbi:DUF29 domain-containing protein [Anabaena cylindrica FACHB-243]|uniref:DUF29 domain-containing protein n=2 Tax=Anabaena TaxID=1163 RepID=K9Z9Y2_ANACC|nr:MULTISPECIES: DUF29 domain-containing protein [Anabaena]AFZ56013.1 protein of unknown function DUF29 [Anabaena cylindrica PCC 7122]MBD2419603.1 DUF29 domain-containing protein [Anabaena cylindrica FACHB-243]MBY5282862.1 DUF29 domain-containing protein [Anabaena sp. CCAP 1446/1C]MBY5306946.1 DUF29 domain-containing protein [Anabaena sp. CCAP 1446/1C]BAY01560.1 hypothetical protein NIES19_07940 [Anabaena cylindrica PCC 7122]
MSLLKTHSPTLYETDYLQWIETTVAKLQGQDYANVDWANLIEEIGDMGRSERKSLKSNLIVILLHLLKWQFQPDKRSGSWEGSIIEHRRRVQESLQDSPSLKPYLESIFTECYTQAVKQAKAETGLPVESFPVICPYHLAEVTEDDFLPNNHGGE